MILLKVNETLGERFREFTSHSAWSLPKATWISMPISKASCSSTQNSDHPQLSHTFRPPRRVKVCLVDPEFPTSSHISWPHRNYPQHRRELPALAGNVAWRGRWGESSSYCSSANPTVLQALQGSTRNSMTLREPVVNVIARWHLPRNPVKGQLMETGTWQHTGNPGISNASLKWPPSHASQSDFPWSPYIFSLLSMVLCMKNTNPSVITEK